MTNISIGKAVRLYGLLFATSVLSAANAAVTNIDGVSFNDTSKPKAVFPSGITEITAKAGASSQVGAVSLANTVGIYAEAEDGAVIRAVAATGATRADINFGLRLTSGTVTLDLAAIGDLPFKFGGVLWVDDAATLVIKGRNSIDFGYVESTANYMPAGIRAKSITFVDAEGNPYEESGKIHFTGSFTEIRIPANVSWDIAEGAVAYIHKSVDAENGIIARFARDGVFTLTDFNLTLLDSVGVEGIDFVVNPGRNLRIMPRSLIFEVGVPLNGNALTTTFGNSVNLVSDEEAQAELSYAYHRTVTHSGDISGNGLVRYSFHRATAAAGLYVSLTGRLTFSGELKMECTAPSSPAAEMRVAQAVPGADGVKVTLGAGCVLKMLPAESSVGTIGSLSGPSSASLLLSDKAAVTFASEPTGGVSVGALGSEMPTVYRGWPISEGEAFVEGPDGTCVWLISPPVASAVRSLSCNGTYGVYFNPKIEDGVVVLPDVKLPDGRGTFTLEARNGEKYANVPNGARVLAKRGVSATVVVGDDDSLILETEEEASLATERTAPFDYAKKASFWLDADKSSSYTQWQLDGVPQWTKVGDASYALVDIWHDCRGAREDLFLRNDKYDLAAAGSIVPYAVTEGLNGRTYVSMALDRRRIAFWNAASVAEKDANPNVDWRYTTASDFRPHYCIMVFGSQNNGGCALVADADKFFARGGDVSDKTLVTKDNSIFANDIPVFVDGVSVNATATGLSGGWQIISFPTYGRQIGGLGFTGVPGDWKTAGYGNYAEVLFFDRELDDIERVTVERALAAKWGLSEGYHDSDIGMRAVSIDVRGKGAVRLGTATTLVPGSFRGRLDLGGQVVSFPSAERPPSSNIVVSAATPLCWFDPNLMDDDHMQKVSASYATVLNTMYDARFGDRPGTSCLSAAGRSPKIDISARGDGLERTWLDFSPAVHPDTVANGRGLRFNVVDSGKDNKVIDGTPSAKTVIMVQDSSKSGGTPFMDTIDGVALSQRNPSYDTYGTTAASAPIWTGASAKFFASGATYLDGVAVDGAVTGFSGGPEVLTAVGGTVFSPGAFGNIYHLNGHTPNNIDAGEIIGEILIYGDELAADARAGVEAYLAWKWFGRAINGYARSDLMSVSGSGTVKVGSHGQVPTFADGFVGTVDMTGVSEFDFTVNAEDGIVEDEVVTSGAISLPFSVVANVTVSSRLRRGLYRLVFAEGGIAASEWRLNLVGTVSSRDVRLKVTDTAVYLEVPKHGTQIVIR